MDASKEIQNALRDPYCVFRRVDETSASLEYPSRPKGPLGVAWKIAESLPWPLIIPFAPLVYWGDGKLAQEYNAAQERNRQKLLRGEVKTRTRILEKCPNGTALLFTKDFNGKTYLARISGI